MCRSKAKHYELKNEIFDVCSFYKPFFSVITKLFNFIGVLIVALVVILDSIQIVIVDSNFKLMLTGK